MWRTCRKLSRMGVLGINRRNACYILKYNPRRLYPLVDDKLRTKQLASNAGIVVPELYGVVETEYQIRKLPGLLSRYTDFAIKPSRGSGGRGILVIAGRSRTLYRKTGGPLIPQEQLNQHVHNILSGLYSLGGQADKALIEYRVQFDPVFEPISYQGVPDVRIVVFLGVPVMSMIRLPTEVSGGRANLHLGAVGAGISIGTGVTLTAVWRNDIITEHPDTGNGVAGIKIPGWEGLLQLAARCSELTGLGYLGVDIVLDKEKGPMILEMNARPGLNIQIANRSGLLPRLNLIEKHHTSLRSIDERIAFAKNHFSG